MSSEIVKALKAWDTYDPNISEEKVLRQAHAVIDAARPLLARIEALEAEVARLREDRMKQIDYSCDLQRIIEDLCGGREIREPKTTARHHYDMAVAARARRAREGGNEDG